VAFDNSRFTFDPWRNYSGVVMEQGRVQPDADWNEWLAEVSRRIQAGTLDIMGHAAYPATTPAAFQISVAAGTPDTVSIGCGRMYVDGLLAENHGLHANAQWDPALAELSGSPQPPPQPPPPPSSANTVDFTRQPYLPGAAQPTGTGPYLFYLDVWTRPVTFLEDPRLIDEAVGVDTTGRLQTVWQVKWMAFPQGTSYTCETPDSQIAYPAASAGRLSSNVVPNPTAGPCCLTTGTGYTGVENQFYRVEVHQGGAGADSASLGGATFKWSRDNASVATGVTAIATGSDTAGNSASVLTVMSLGRDQVLGFSPGDWIEILDDWTQLWGIAGILCQIDSISVSARTITLTSTVPTGTTTAGATPPSFPVDGNSQTDPHRHTRIVRWDQSGTVYKLSGTQQEPWCDLAATGGMIPVPAADTTLILEDGITVTFGTNPAGGAFNVGDFWTFAARTADGKVETLVDAPPRGIHHHYTKLSTVTLGSSPSAPDCRTPFACAEQGACGCCVCTVGEGGQYSSINQAIAALPEGGGEVCILPGLYREYVVVKDLSGVVIRGCGALTRLASAPTAAAGITQSGLTAVITVTGSQNIELRNLAIEAAKSDAGILLDQLPGANADNIDVTIEDLVITASEFPAIAAVDVQLLQISGNRIAMADVAGLWPAVYVRGTEIHIERNWIGLQDASNALNWIPAVVAEDLDLSGGLSSAPSPAANGGIQIAGSSQDVFITENEIEGGSRNGIALGSFVLLNGDGNDTGAVTGVLAAEPAAAGATLQLPKSGFSGRTQGTLAAGPGMQNIQIARNRVRNMGLCGIGPVGFFDLAETLEVISIENLAITANTISGTLQNSLAPFEGDASLFGYGAICIPDVQNLIIRDNTVTDFGNLPGAQVCGIFVLNGEQIEIARNQVLETRDWSTVPDAATYSANAMQAGIMVMLVMPPALDQATAGSAWASSFAGAEGQLAPPVYQPGLPALRIESNVVRVPLGVALAALGFGPFAIVGNHLSSGGTLDATTDPTAAFEGALTVLVMNLGLAIEFDPPGTTYGSYFYNESPLVVSDNLLSPSSSGAVLFANNLCQLETRASAATGFASVEILSLDHLIFSNNHCWLDGPGGGSLTAFMDVLLFSLSLHAGGNRFQEAVGSVWISGYTYGVKNITAQNIATYCLFAEGPTGGVIGTPNLIGDSTLCPERLAP
jgi:hypothetical protein